MNADHSHARKFSERIHQFFRNSRFAAQETIEIG
jgi:hypothetical protein